jgi:hypothetical protein
MFHLGARRRQLIFAVCALLVSTWVIPWTQANGFDSQNSEDASRLLESTPSSSQICNPPATLIYPAMLAEYYEHGREHAPPRSPDGSMQRRELFYRAPPDPFDIIESLLRTTVPDRQFFVDLLRLKTRWAAGDGPDDQTIAIIRADAGLSSIPGITLLNVARGFQWLVNDKLASAVFSAGLQKSWDEIRLNPRDDKGAQELLNLLDQTRVLWSAEDPDALVNRFRIARRLSPRLSIASRRAGFHLAEELVADERAGEAANLILEVEKEHRQAGDLGKRDKSDISEMTLVTGVTLFAAERYRDAVPYLALIQGDQATPARTFLFEALLRSGQLEEARRLLGEVAPVDRRPNGPESPTSRLEEVVNREQWKIEAGPPSEGTHH